MSHSCNCDSGPCRCDHTAERLKESREYGEVARALHGIRRFIDRIPGGRADNRPDSDFDPVALAKGIKVEMEHTDDPDIAREIAKDHLTERADYYDRLEVVERDGALK